MRQRGCTPECMFEKLLLKHTSTVRPLFMSLIIHGFVSGRSGGNVWTTSLSSTKNLCVALFVCTSAITTDRGCTYRLRRIHQIHDPYSRSAKSSRFPKSAACITATNVAPPEQLRSNADLNGRVSLIDIPSGIFGKCASSNGKETSRTLDSGHPHNCSPAGLNVPLCRQPDFQYAQSVGRLNIKTADRYDIPDKADLDVSRALL